MGSNKKVGLKKTHLLKVRDIRDVLKGLSTDATLHFEVKAQDGSTWILDAEVEVTTEDLVSLRLSHPELLKLPIVDGLLTQNTDTLIEDCIEELKGIQEDLDSKKF